MSEQQVAEHTSTRTTGGGGLSDAQKNLYAFVGLVALTTWVFFPILHHMYRTWRGDPDYSHGLLIVPLALYFAYGKLPQLKRAPIDGSWWGALILFIGVISVCIGELGGLLTALRSGYVFAVMGFVLLLFGRGIAQLHDLDLEAQ